MGAVNQRSVHTARATEDNHHRRTSLTLIFYFRSAARGRASVSFASIRVVQGNVRLGCGCGRRLVTGSCVIRETTQTGCPWSRPRVSLSIYLSIYRQALHLWRLQPNLDRAPLERLHALVGSLSLGTADD